MGGLGFQEVSGDDFIPAGGAVPSSAPTPPSTPSAGFPEASAGDFIAANPYLKGSAMLQPNATPPDQLENIMPEDKALLGGLVGGIKEMGRGVVPLMAGLKTGALAAAKLSPQGRVASALGGLASGFLADAATRAIQNRVIGRDESLSTTASSAALDTLFGGLGEWVGGFKSVKNALAKQSYKESLRGGPITEGMNLVEALRLNPATDKVVGKQINRAGEQLVKENVMKGTEYNVVDGVLTSAMKGKPTGKTLGPLAQHNAQALGEFSDIMASEYDAAHFGLQGATTPKLLPAPDLAAPQLAIGEAPAPALGLAGASAKEIGDGLATKLLPFEGEADAYLNAQLKTKYPSIVKAKALASPEDASEIALIENQVKEVLARTVPPPSTLVRRMRDSDVQSTMENFSSRPLSEFMDSAVLDKSLSPNFILLQRAGLERPERFMSVVQAMAKIKENDAVRAQLGAFRGKGLAGQKGVISQLLKDDSNRLRAFVEGRGEELRAAFEKSPEKLMSLKVNPQILDPRTSPVQLNHRESNFLALSGGWEKSLENISKRKSDYLASASWAVQPKSSGISFRVGSQGRLTAGESIPSTANDQAAAFAALEGQRNMLGDVGAVLEGKPNPFPRAPFQPPSGVFRTNVGPMVGALGLRPLIAPGDLQAQEPPMPIVPQPTPSMAEQAAASLMSGGGMPPVSALTPDVGPMPGPTPDMMGALGQMPVSTPLTPDVVAPQSSAGPSVAQNPVPLPRDMGRLFKMPPEAFSAFPEDVQKQLHDAATMPEGLAKGALTELMQSGAVPFEDVPHEWLKGYSLINDRVEDPGEVVMLSNDLMQKERDGKIGQLQSAKIRRALHAQEPITDLFKKAHPKGVVNPPEQPKENPTEPGVEGAPMQGYSF